MEFLLFQDLSNLWSYLPVCPHSTTCHTAYRHFDLDTFVSLIGSGNSEKCPVSNLSLSPKKGQREKQKQKVSA